MARFCRALVGLMVISSSLLFVVPPTRNPQVPAGPVPHSTFTPLLNPVALRFEPNEGQFSQPVRFAARNSGFSLFLTQSAIVLAPRQSSHRSAAEVLKFVGANPDARIGGFELLSSVSNYFRGSDPRQWRSGVPNFAEVEYREIYPGIHLICYSSQKSPEFDWIVDPGADPGRIRLSVPPDSASLDEAGDLVFRFPEGSARLKRPVIYQETGLARSPVSGGYTLSPQGEISFHITEFDHTRRLVIDPVLVYSTYFGGSVDDEPSQIAVDGNQNIYIVGTTSSPDMPTAGPLPGQSALTGATEAFIAKFDPTGATLLYSTFLGGTTAGHADRGVAIAVDAAGDAFVTGTTNDKNFPTTSGAFLPAPGGGMCDGCTAGWMSELAPDGSSLLYSTYISGTQDVVSCTPSGIAVDSMGSAYLTGSAGGVGFPVTSGAFTTPAGNQTHVFITKITPAANPSLTFSSLFGGTATDAGTQVAVDSSLSPYVTGNTTSTDFPTTTMLVPPNEPSQTFVVKMKPDFTGLLFSTLFGSGTASGIAVDSAGSAYVTGFADSTQFPTAGTMHTSLQSVDAFVSKLDPTGATLVYSIFLGGSRIDQASGIALDANKNAYVTGLTTSNDFPTVLPTQSVYSGGTSCTSTCQDAFVSEISADGSQILFSTYLGDAAADAGKSVAVDSVGSIYVTGTTSSGNFPLSNMPFQAQQNATDAGLGNGFVSKFATNVSISPQRMVFGSAPLGQSQGQPVGSPSSPLTATFTNGAGAAVTFASNAETITGAATTDFNISNDTCQNSTVMPSGTCSVAVVFTPTNSGVRSASLQLSNSAANSPFAVSLLGFGSALTFSPTSLTFDPQPPGTTSAPQTLMIANAGTSSVQITSVTMGGADSSFFGIPADGCTGTTLTAGMSCDVAITFSPGMAKVYSGSVVITDTSDAAQQTIPISAIGSGPLATLSPSPTPFANQQVGSTSVAQVVTLTNPGSAALTISDISVNGPFSQTNNCPGSLGPSFSCGINVTFAPTAAGPASGTLVVTDTAPSNSQFVNLQGQGLDFTISAPSVASVTRGGNTSVTVTITQAGGGFFSPVKLACAGLPTLASCAFSPSDSVTPNTSMAQATVTISAAASLVGGRKWDFNRLGTPAILPAALLSGALLLFFARPGSRRRLIHAAFLLTASVWFLASCGGSGGGSGSTSPPPISGTPPGTYSMVITGTSGALNHNSQPITLTVLQ